MKEAGRVAHQNYYCLPLVVETMGTWCIDATKLFNKLRKRISQTNQDLSLKELKLNYGLFKEGTLLQLFDSFLPTYKMEKVINILFRQFNR